MCASAGTGRPLRQSSLHLHRALHGFDFLVIIPVCRDKKDTYISRYLWGLQVTGSVAYSTEKVSKIDVSWTASEESGMMRVPPATQNFLFCSVYKQLPSFIFSQIECLEAVKLTSAAYAKKTGTLLTRRLSVLSRRLPLPP